MTSFRLLASFLILPSPALAVEQDWEWHLGGSLESTFFYADQPSASLLDFDDRHFENARFSLALDVHPSEHWFFHARGRLDRGFDPGNREEGQFRLDEAFLRYQPLGDSRLNFQFGKFASIFGSYITQHDFHDDPFLLAPLAYGEILGVGVLSPNANTPEAILARATGAAPGVFDSAKNNWTSTVWGPAYTSGASIFGSVDKLDYAFAIKNVQPGANPDQWDPSLGDFDSPTFSGRLGYRPNAAWNLGFSFTRGPYLDPGAEIFLPTGIDRGDLPLTRFGVDLRWAHHDFVFSGEAIHSNYETLSGDDLKSFSWHLQTRWKFAPGTWLAGRLGQTINNDARGPSGEALPWSPDLLRAEIGVGWRITPDLLLKAQYSYTKSSGQLQGPGRNTFAAGFGWRF